MTLDVAGIYRNARDAWPDCDTDDLLWVAPMGSRRDALIYNRKTGMVTTGRRGEGPCFNGSLDVFEQKIEEDYGQRLDAPYSDHAALIRRRDEYRALVVFLRSLPNIWA